MSKKIFCFILTIVLTISLIGCTNDKASKLTMEEKIQDFEYLFNEIKNSYPFMEVNQRVNGVDWISNKEEYLERIKNTKNDEEFISELSLIIRALNNGHTHLINSKESFDMFKSNFEGTNLYDFFDNPVVVERYESMKSKSRGKNHTTEDLILKDVVEDKVGYIYIPMMIPQGESEEEDITRIEEYIKTLGNHQALIIDIRGNGGGSDSYWMETLYRVVSKKINHKSYILFKDGDILNNYIDKLNITEFLKSVDELPQEILKNAPKDTLETFNTFLERDMSLFPLNKSKFKGNVYLLIDDKVYSSAEAMAVLCKDTKIATLIGQKTAGDGCGVTPMLFNLKNSGLIVRMSACLLLTQEGFCNEEFKTTPDYFIEDITRTKDFKDDACINKVLEIENIK